VTVRSSGTLVPQALVSGVWWSTLPARNFPSRLQSRNTTSTPTSTTTVGVATFTSGVLPLANSGCLFTIQNVTKAGYLQDAAAAKASPSLTWA
jgi:hypothetical protein